MLFFPHDMDFFGPRPTGRMPDNQPVLSRLCTHPPYRRMFFGHVVDLITTGYERSYFRSWVEYATARSPEQAQHLEAAAQFNDARVASLLEGSVAITRQIPCVSFGVSSVLRPQRGLIVVRGVGWVTEDSLILSLPGGPLRVGLCWTDETHWMAALNAAVDGEAPAQLPQSFSVIAVDRHDTVVGAASVQLSGVGALPQDRSSSADASACAAAWSPPTPFNKCDLQPALVHGVCGGQAPAVTSCCSERGCAIAQGGPSAIPTPPSPVVEGRCGADTFARRALMVNAECCPAQSGHRRRAQSGCAIPTVCPSANCAATFVPFFAECRDLLAEMPDLSQYSELNADCIAKSAAGNGFDSGSTAVDCAQQDDSAGALRSMGISCATLVGTVRMSCGLDLQNNGWPVRASLSASLCNSLCNCLCSVGASRHYAGRCLSTRVWILLRRSACVSA